MSLGTEIAENVPAANRLAHKNGLIIVVTDVERDANVREFGQSPCILVL